MLGKGAVISRSLFQHFVAKPVQSSYSISLHHDLHINLAKNIPKDTLDAIISEGRRLYPQASTRDTNSKSSDWNTFYNTSIPYSLAAAPETLSGALREVLVQGRYAPYNKKYQVEQNKVHSAMARNPEIVAMLEVNGYTVNEIIMNSM